jgi:RNA polymerase sigma-70 factor (ECF subfamily)
MNQDARTSHPGIDPDGGGQAMDAAATPEAAQDWSLLDDRVLVKAYLNGDSKAFEVLFRKYRDVVHRLVYSIVKDDTLVHDVVQEVFLLVYRHLHKFRQDSAFKTWVYRIAVNEAIRHLGRQKRWQPLPETEQELPPSTTLIVSSVGESPERLVIQGEQRNKISAAIGSLKPHHRVILNLFYLEELPVQEIATVLDIPEGSVKSRLYYARDALKKLLDPILFPNLDTIAARHVVA